MRPKVVIPMDHAGIDVNTALHGTFIPWKSFFWKMDVGRPRKVNGKANELDKKQLQKSNK